jgi:drug/metabolite transporter (DMT)-like permease
VVEDRNMSVQEAAAVVQDARARARRELVISAPLVYMAWGLVWLLGYGAMWLSVRGQHPYTGPSGPSIATLFILAGFAVAAVLVIVSKAAAGIDGQSVRYRRIILAAFGAGYLILFIVQFSISSSVSTRTLAFVAFAGPLLLAGLTYILASALGRNRPAFALGASLVIVGASCAWLAPAAILAVCALAGGGAFLLLALIETRLRAHAR